MLGALFHQEFSQLFFSLLIMQYARFHISQWCIVLVPLLCVRSGHSGTKNYPRDSKTFSPFLTAVGQRCVSRFHGLSQWWVFILFMTQFIENVKSLQKTHTHVFFLMQLTVHFDQTVCRSLPTWAKIFGSYLS